MGIQKMAQGNSDVRETLDGFFRSVESRDLDRITPYFEEDAQMFSPLGAYPARLDDRAAIMEQFKAISEALKQMPTPIRIDPQEMVVREFGDIALATFHLKLAGPLHRRSFILRKRAGRWRIAHIHASIASAT
jgi:ketosteroid isomerase-like protein